MPTSSVGGPLPTEARQGRHKQKYGQSGERLLAGCIPFRVTEGNEGKNEVEVLLVTRRNGRGWVLPKGGWESDEDNVESAARRETVEEAGVRGVLVGQMLGAFELRSKKRQHDPVNTCLVHIFAMRVMEQLDSWPEKAFRKREWFSVVDAYNLCMDEWMRSAFRAWIQRNNWASLITNGVDVGKTLDDEKSKKKISETTTSSN